MDQKTVDTYNKLAAEYDAEVADFWKRFPSEVFDRFIELVGGGRVLDVGSGSGRDGAILKDHGATVVCLDAAEAMVKLSASRGLESVQGDFNNLPFPDASFDGVWAYTSLLHVPKAKIDKPLSEIFRVLKTGGVFGLGLIEGEGELYRLSSGMDRPRWFSFYTKEEVRTLFKKHHIEEIYFGEFPMHTKNYLNFIGRKEGA